MPEITELIVALDSSIVAVWYGGDEVDMRRIEMRTELERKGYRRRQVWLWEPDDNNTENNVQLAERDRSGEPDSVGNLLDRWPHSSP